MIQVIDEAYLRRMTELPDGWRRLLDWTSALLQERDDARMIAQAVVRDAEPARRQQLALQAANTELVQRLRDLRFEMQAETAFAELEVHPLRSPRDEVRA